MIVTSHKDGKNFFGSSAFFFFPLSEAQMLSLSIVTKRHIVILKVWVCQACVTNGKSLYGEQQIPKNM